MEIFKKTFTLSQKVSSQKFGDVFLAIINETNQLSLCFVMSEEKVNGDFSEELLEYLEVISDLSEYYHEGLVNIIGGEGPSDASGNYIIAMELFEGRDSRTFFENEIINNRILIDFFEKITSCVDYLHFNEIEFKNIRPSNLYVLEDKSIKLACFPNPEEVNNFYLPPESKKISEIDKRGDIYNLGLTFIMLINRTNHAEQTNYSKHLEINQEIKKRVPKNLLNLLLEMTNIDPKTRIKDMKTVIKKLRDIRKNLSTEELNKIILEPYSSSLSNSDVTMPTIVINEKTVLKALPDFKQKGESGEQNLLSTKVEFYRKAERDQSVRATFKKKPKHKNINKSRKQRPPQRQRHSLSLDSSDAIEDKESKINLGYIILTLMVLVFFYTKFIKQDLKNEEQILTLKDTGVYVKELRPISRALADNRSFNNKTISKRLKKIDQRLVKYKNDKRFPEYMYKHVELIEIAIMNDSEYLVHRVLDDMENEMSIFE